MIRWIQEWLDPSKKCARRGHAEAKVMESDAIAKPWLIAKQDREFMDRAVAYRVKMRAGFCARCKEPVDQPTVIRVYNSIQRLGMSVKDWQTLKERGYVWD